MARSQREYDELQRGSGIMDRDHKPIIELESEEKTVKKDISTLQSEIDDILGVGYSVPEVAKILRRKESTVYSMLQRGELNGTKVFGEWQVSEEDIKEWAKEQAS